MFPQSLGIILCALFVVLKDKDRKQIIFHDKKTYLNMLVGILQAVGNIVVLICTEKLGNEVMSPFLQLSTVVTIILGYYYLKEKKQKPYDFITVVGSGLIVIGSIGCGCATLFL
ncbi:hypothetical protein FACS189459_6970 [Bacilli bacterium]|nr:hypothetical protein FACS189459_6970 [Bacilli bacterium]